MSQPSDRVDVGSENCLMPGSMHQMVPAFLLNYRCNLPRSETDLRDVDKTRSHRFSATLDKAKAVQVGRTVRRTLCNNQICVGEVVHRMSLGIDVVDGDENICAAGSSQMPNADFNGSARRPRPLYN